VDADEHSPEAPAPLARSASTRPDLSVPHAVSAPATGGGPAATAATATAAAVGAARAIDDSLAPPSKLLQRLGRAKETDYRRASADSAAIGRTVAAVRTKVRRGRPLPRVRGAYA
jgi:hypothetical protein